MECQDCMDHSLCKSMCVNEASSFEPSEQWQAGTERRACAWGRCRRARGSPVRVFVAAVPVRVCKHRLTNSRSPNSMN
ncbi:unnamed protein product [Arctia plantaginis]|uniref:Uncharacterized protein n=1 Tax=Arctia plantaginis TaxID=874455 RepID=A0A8S1AR71_ARCPL|nr:unnamed protein product [Arctia plantaginis]CAB3247566.1 unnamed protein product [Arctia plantaginis]